MSLRVAERDPAVAPSMAGDGRLKRVLRIGEGARRESNTCAKVGINQIHRPFIGFMIANNVYLGAGDSRVRVVYNAIQSVKDRLLQQWEAEEESKANSSETETVKRVKSDPSCEERVTIRDSPLVPTIYDYVITVRGTRKHVPGKNWSYRGVTYDASEKTTTYVEVTLSATSNGEAVAVTPIGPTNLTYEIRLRPKAPPPSSSAQQGNTSNQDVQIV